MPERHPLTIIHNSMYMNEYWKINKTSCVPLLVPEVL